ncbi:RGS1-HXK1-interacting protein 1 [Heracleum sosnowskyi]|uniref:RGS1-HXK1-interacting protein 1 n=1 Tax=Heracleum sosnowskyi TaxID=360622 RepID=A0AAD8JBZ7_9APIA|nr:RGS1-HXK1-interacting protein 1 [Heracleum sosnowskyi]
MGEETSSEKSSKDDFKTKLIHEEIVWIDYAVQQAQIAQKTIQDSLDSAISLAQSRFNQIRDTSAAHLSVTADYLEELKSEYNAYENLAFGKIKDGILLAAANPLLTSGVVLASGLIISKKPRRALYYKSMRFFSSEETLFSKAEAKVNRLKESIDSLKKESEALEKGALQAEEEMKRGRKKLRQAGNQIQGVTRTAYKIEREAAGLKDILKELPRREASRFRSEVSKLGTEAKRERQALSKKVTKISNYGISV